MFASSLYGSQASQIKQNSHCSHFLLTKKRKRGRETQTDISLVVVFTALIIISGEYLMTRAQCDSVLESEVNRSPECEIVNIAVQYLIMVSYSLSAGPHCLHSAIICGFSLPTRMRTVNSPPVETQRKRVTLSHQIICYIIHRPQ